jgi:hypothetical protein
MAEAFVHTIKRDYGPDAEAVMHQLSLWITHTFTP